MTNKLEELKRKMEEAEVAADAAIDAACADAHAAHVADLAAYEAFIGSCDVTYGGSFTVRAYAAYDGSYAARAYAARDAARAADLAADAAFAVYAKIDFIKTKKSYNNELNKNNKQNEQ